jgi:hypothetical protein
MSREEIFERIVAHWALRSLARMAIIVILLFFVVSAAICVDNGEWVWVAVYAIDLYFCLCVIRRLWPKKTTK